MFSYDLVNQLKHEFSSRENDFDGYRKLNFILNIYREVMSSKLGGYIS